MAFGATEFESDVSDAEESPLLDVGVAMLVRLHGPTMTAHVRGSQEAELRRVAGIMPPKKS